MKKSTKKHILIGAAAALAVGLIPYEGKVEKNGDFSLTSLLFGVYRRHHPETGKATITVTFANAPCFTAEAKARRDAALRHSIEAAAERELFADEDDPTEGAASAPAAPEAAEEAAAPEAPAETSAEAAPEEAPAAEAEAAPAENAE